MRTVTYIRDSENGPIKTTYEGISDTPDPDAPIVVHVHADGEVDVWYADSLMAAMKQLPSLYIDSLNQNWTSMQFYARIQNTGLS